ncbi:Aryl hydrocarbon receptor nuclear translocator [Fasciola hepatica]|uniref:Aryl hydrocarbon receptor nuclear translocator n=1 Tax=Fasciola hepatica TaxID=6192 RepID=A0A4E0S405_FASHE|nr:Aryl hydrocarbon receptor nuclear translocator [Fasciola hepatica]
MERSPSTPKSLSKSQRESHSEIERKRRERMKRDTEFLRKQVSHTQCKDKLSIFQAGAEKLIQYTDKLGKREYIINDEEYSQIIMNVSLSFYVRLISMAITSKNFDGFDIHVRCSDGKVLKVHENVKRILDVAVDDVVGQALQDLAEPSFTTRQIISDAFHGSEFQWDIFKGVVARNFIVALRCGSRIPSKHCIYGCDGGIYRFIEFCGDLVPHTDGVDSKLFIIFRGLCRPLDPVSSTVLDPVEQNTSVSSNSDVPVPTSVYRFTLRLAPDTLLITEVVGDFQRILGTGNGPQPATLLNRCLQDTVYPSDKTELEQRLLEVRSQRHPTTFTLRLIHLDTGSPVSFEARLSPICFGQYLHCLVCCLTAAEPPQSNHLRPVSAEQVSRDGGRSAMVHPCQFLPADVKPAITPVTNIECGVHVSAVDSTGVSVLERPVQIGSSTVLKPDDGVSFDAIPEVQHPAADQNVDESWFRDVDTSSFQSLLNNCNPTVDALLPDYLMTELPDTDADIGP